MKSLKLLTILAICGISSGISFGAGSITYTATPGTGGTGTPATDYTQATGGGANVSTSIPATFMVDKKIAIGVVEENGTYNSMFNGSASLNLWMDVNRSRVLPLDTTSHYATYTNVSLSRIFVMGVIYTQADVSVTADASDFVSELNPNFSIKNWTSFNLNQGSGYGNILMSGIDDNDSSTSVFPLTAHISASDLATSNNLGAWLFQNRVYLDTISINAPSGLYTSTVSLTVAAL